MRWMNLEPIIQSEVSKKEKDKYHILMHIYESRKMVLKNLFTGQQWRNWRRQWHPTPVLLPGKSHRWRSLVGYSPWGC